MMIRQVSILLVLVLAFSMALTIPGPHANATQLALEKVVINDDGGTAMPSDFTLTATGPTPISGDGSVVSVVDPGTYTLSETVAPGYSPSPWVCVGDGTQSGNQITLEAGESATCSISNNDIVRSEITVCKSDSEGNPVAGWGIYLSSGQVGWTEGDGCLTFAVFEAGDYSITEENRAGWQKISPVSGQYHITVEPGHNYGPLSFINFQHATVTACKSDADGNPLEGWVIQLREGDSTVIREEVTNSSGCVLFTIASPGEYSLAEVLQPGWVQLEPAGGQYDFTATSGYEGVYSFVNTHPSLDVEKKISISPDGPWYDHIEVIVGAVLYYQITISNDGVVPVENIAVTDPSLAVILDFPSDYVFCSIDRLEEGEIQTCDAIGPIHAEFTGDGLTSDNTARAEGCHELACSSDSDTASYTCLYWAFTPGFWRNHQRGKHDAWEYTAYDPQDRVCDIFTAACGEGYVGSNTHLCDALKFHAGKSETGAGNILLRTAVASLLNSSFHEEMDNLIGVDGVFPYSSSEIVDMVNNALATQDRQTMLTLADILDNINNGIDEIEWR